MLGIYFSVDVSPLWLKTCFIYPLCCESNRRIIGSVKSGERIHWWPFPHVLLVQEVAVNLTADELVLHTALHPAWWAAV